MLPLITCLYLALSPACQSIVVAFKVLFEHQLTAETSQQTREQDQKRVYMYLKKHRHDPDQRGRSKVIEVADDGRSLKLEQLLFAGKSFCGLSLNRVLRALILATCYAESVRRRQSHVAQNKSRNKVNYQVELDQGRYF